MRTSVPKKLARSHHARTQNGENLPALELSNSTKDAWLIAHSQTLRIPLMSMGSMLSLMELGHELARVRPLHEAPSDFDEAAFRHVRKNFQRLVQFFNELSALAGQGPLRIESGPPSGEKPGTVASINSTNEQT
ncbi:MAG TPA: hypothetical protein VNW72_06255 [Chthoniobacterales bacterium]|nr:hypothetical protein [Chthoniobacterales bacterium]